MKDMEKNNGTTNRKNIAANLVKGSYYLCGAGLSWMVVCGIHKLVTMCLGTTFKWSMASSIWFMLFICFLLRNKRSKK